MCFIKSYFFQKGPPTSWVAGKDPQNLDIRKLLSCSQSLPRHIRPNQVPKNHKTFSTHGSIHELWKEWCNEGECKGNCEKFMHKGKLNVVNLFHQLISKEHRKLCYAWNSIKKSLLYASASTSASCSSLKKGKKTRENAMQTKICKGIIS